MKHIIITLLALAALAHARPVAFGWDAVEVPVAGYELMIRAVGEEEWTVLGETTETEIVTDAPDSAFEAAVRCYVLITGTDPDYEPQRFYSPLSHSITVPETPAEAPGKLRVIPLPVPLSWLAPQDEGGESRRVALQHSSDLETWTVLADGNATMMPNNFFRLALY